MQGLRFFGMRLLIGVFFAAGFLLAFDGGRPADAGSSDVFVESYWHDPWDPVVEEEVYFSFTITNAGASSAGSFWVDFYPDRPEAPDQFEPGLHACRIETLGPLASQNCNFTMAFGAQGEYHWWLVLDREGEVWESDETNNVLSNYLVVQDDSDGDGVGDQDDNCLFWPNPSQTPPPWTVPANDSDCDGFSDAREIYLGTDMTFHCAADTVRNNEAWNDRWPADMDDNRTANTLDIGVFVFTLNESNPNHPGPNTNPSFNPRHDLNGNGIINTLDIGTYVFVLNKTCAPSGP